MILIFDFFETIVHNKSMDFNRGLKVLWEKHYKEKCSFEEIVAFGEELFRHMQELHEQGLEYAFVKDELPQYAEKYGGEIIQMTAEEEADFLMLCNEMEPMSHIPEALAEFEQMGIPMYVLSNSGFTAEALSIALEKLGIRQYFQKIWSSADFGKIKPSKAFFEQAIAYALAENPAKNREDIVFVGDMYSTDVKGANAAGIDVIWLNHKGEENVDNLSLHDICGSKELVECVKEIRKPSLKKVAFICVHNSCRSQIAEALGKHLASDVFESYSAGTETKPRINQDAVRIMKDIHGIDMEQTQYSKLITDIPEPDIAISMGCNVGCPFVGRPFDDNWELEDPTGKSDEEFLTIIKRIEDKILKLRDDLC